MNISCHDQNDPHFFSANITMLLYIFYDYQHWFYSFLHYNIILKRITLHEI